MFNFFIKKSEIVLDCFTHNHSAYENAKIDYAYKYMPEWWRKTPRINESTDQATIKNCVAFIDFYTKGICIPSWFEFEMKINKLDNPDNIWYQWQASDETFSASNSHQPSQFINFSENDGKNFKINSPWLFKEKDDVKFVWSQPTWSLKSIIFNAAILPGVISFKHQHATNINFFISNRTYEQEFSIQPLTPLVILHPMSDKKVKIVNHLISKEEWNNKMNNLNTMVLGTTTEKITKAYNTKVNLSEKIENVKKCPFH
jgi:hypothetical protein